MLYVLRQENLLDRAFIQAHTTGWDQLDQILTEYAPEKVVEATGLSGRAHSGGGPNLWAGKSRPFTVEYGRQSEYDRGR